MVKVGIIGLGHLHPESYMPHFAACADTQVTAVCDADAARLGRFSSRFGVKAYADWQTLIREAGIDLAFIFLPHCDCDAAAIACAEHGIHVVVEKPVASTSSKALAIANACARAGVLFSTPYVWRMHPVVRKMKETLASGLLGQITACEGRCAAGGLHRYIEGGAEWMLDRQRSGGGPMYNLGVHWIDLYRWMLGAEVTEVIGRNMQVDPARNIEDNSFAIATFDSGTVLSLDISYTVPDSFPYGRDLYLGIRGTRGCMTFTPSFEGLRQTLLICSDHPGFGGAPRQTLTFELTEAPGYFGSVGLEYVKEVARDVREQREPFIGGRDAVRTLCVAEAVYESAQRGCTVPVHYI